MLCFALLYLTHFQSEQVYASIVQDMFAKLGGRVCADSAVSAFFALVSLLLFNSKVIVDLFQSM